MSNHYFICLPNQGNARPFDPSAYEQSDYPGFIEIDYLASAFQTLERESAPKGLTFYVTWNVQELPSYGHDVVVVLIGDEWCHRPNYLNKVKAVFRQYGTHPELVRQTFDKPSQLNIMLLLQFLRAIGHGALGRLRFDNTLGYTKSLSAPQYVVPLGYANQLDLPVTEIASRPLDVYFAGSVNNQKPSIISPKYWLQSPKNVARRRAISSANQLKAKRPDLNVQLETTSEHVPSKLKGTASYREEAKRYSHKLMNAKICLVPRGSSLDTPRFFEALRYGCVAIADRLPSKWFYDGAPVIQVDDWDNLEQLVEELLDDPVRMQRLHQAALDYWRTSCSKVVLGRFIAEQLTAPSHAAVPREHTVTPAMSCEPRSD